MYNFIKIGRSMQQHATTTYQVIKPKHAISCIQLVPGITCQLDAVQMDAVKLCQ